MPRIRQRSAEYAEEDFITNIRCCQGQQNLMSVRSLAEAAGMPHTTLNQKLKDPERFTVADFRNLIPVLHPDPVTVLTLLGYSTAELKKLRSMEND